MVSEEFVVSKSLEVVIGLQESGGQKVSPRGDDLTGFGVQ